MSDTAVESSEFRRHVLEGLSRKPKVLSAKYLYDERGSQLFEQICELDEYYVTRTEVALLESVADEIARHIGPEVAVLEPGSGAGDKIRILLRHLVDPVAYVPFDISPEILEASAQALARDFPDIEVLPVVGDFTGSIELPAMPRPPRRRLLFFPGSTIGNFRPEGARGFLAQAKAAVGEEGMLLVGIDRKKDKAVLEAAYDDAAGVTAEFNLNLLDRINRELGADFDRSQFRHRALYDEGKGRIEMHLESLVAQEVRLGDESFDFAAGESIRTELSHKYHPEEFLELARQAGLQAAGHWTDPKAWFSLHLLK